MGIECGIDKNGDSIVREQGVGTLLRIIRDDLKDIQAISEFLPIDLQLPALGGFFAFVFTEFPFGKAKNLFLQCTDASTGQPRDTNFTWTVGAGVGVPVAYNFRGSRLDLQLAEPIIAPAGSGILAVSIANTLTGIPVRVRGYAAAF